jgi:hypothetical protein
MAIAILRRLRSICEVLTVAEFEEAPMIEREMRFQFIAQSRKTGNDHMGVDRSSFEATHRGKIVLMALQSESMTHKKATQRE